MDTEKKKDLLQAVIDKLSNEANLMEKSIESEYQTIKDAPGANKSWSDTTRSQMEDLLKGKINLLSDLEKGLITLKNLKAKISQMTTAQLGAVVETQSKNGKKEVYLIIPSGGEEIVFKDKAIILLSYSSLISSTLRGHKKGDRVTVRFPTGGTRTLTILEVS